MDNRSDRIDLDKASNCGLVQMAPILDIVWSSIAAAAAESRRPILRQVCQHTCQHSYILKQIRMQLGTPQYSTSGSA
jgi:hypothetical protein